jgi:2-haloacid dehalogenase
MMNDISSVKALTFDVFGTVVDWRISIIREGEHLDAVLSQHIDWGQFADAWRNGYAPAMNRVRHGELPWMTIDQLHRMILDQLLHDFQIHGLSEADKDHLNRAWHRLTPWPDSVAGLERLRKRFIITTLSNGNMALLINMAKQAGLPWDCILSAELAGHYKPDPEVYQMAGKFLGLPLRQVMMVAAHKDDLRAAQATGMKAAFVQRPLEFGPARKPDIDPDPAFEVNASDLLDLAMKLGV